MQDPWSGDEEQPPGQPLNPPTRRGAMFRAYPQPPGEAPSSDERTMAMLCHLLAIFTWFIGPLILWLMKKNESRFIDFHGRAALNWAISYFAYMVILMVLVIVAAFLPPLGCLCVPVILALSLADIILKVLLCIAASNGEWKDYPLAIPFLGIPRP